jgi:hypothetical protein
MWELKLKGGGELERVLRWGGGVIEDALGLLYPDAEGEVAGDDGSLAPGMCPNKFRMFSSSDGVLISTSLSREDRNDGTAPFDCGGLGLDAEGAAPFNCGGRELDAEEVDSA